MRNIFLFIRRYFNLLTFVFLQVFCIYFIVTYSKYHAAAFGSTANRLTGNVNREYNKVEYYFRLKKTNDSLMAANERLYNKLRADFNVPDSVSKLVIDTIRVDSSLRFKKFDYLSTKVVSNSVSGQSNFIVLWGPNIKMCTRNMGVVDANNHAVGIITDISGDYAVVMSLLHKDSHLSVKLNKGGESGILNWSGENPTRLSLSNISKSARVVKGDSVVTSGFSAIFPKGLLVGRVTAIFAESSNNNYRIELQPAADFSNLEYAYAIRSADAEPVRQLIEKAKSANN